MIFSKIKKAVLKEKEPEKATWTRTLSAEGWERLYCRKKPVKAATKAVKKPKASKR